MQLQLVSEAVDKMLIPSVEILYTTAVSKIHLNDTNMHLAREAPKCNVAFPSDTVDKLCDRAIPGKMRLIRYTCHVPTPHVANTGEMRPTSSQQPLEAKARKGCIRNTHLSIARLQSFRQRQSRYRQQH